MPATILDNKPLAKHARLTRDLRERIVRGELRPGDRLPTFTELRARHGIALSTIEKVISALEKENLVERRQGSGTYVKRPIEKLTGNIGFIGGEQYKAPKTPFYQHLMGAMQQAASQERRHLLHLGSSDDWDLSHCEKVDALVLCNIEDTRSILQELPPHLPRVSVLTMVDGVTSVGVDDYRAAQIAVRHLLENGHQRIACLMERLPSESRRRYNGYRDALLEAGIEADPNWVRLTDSLDREEIKVTAQPYREWARRQMVEWLHDGWQEAGCTAIVVQNEVAAIGVLQIFQKEGIKVPEQISIITFDGTELCDLVSPHLCAVELPLAQIGTKAIELLNRQITGEPPADLTVLLPFTLRNGESVAAIEPAPTRASKILVGCG
jgi:DNA-binding LacI/PurR family transcriptional regulator